LEIKDIKNSLAWKIALNACSVLLGVVFVFSGFVKAVDPLGTCYKIQDYLTAFGWIGLVPEKLPLLMSVALSALEFCVGIMLLLRVRRRIASSLALLLMVIMTPLTLYLAITNPVSDCGCFGDALVLTNWETFFKNVILLSAAIVVFIGHKQLSRLVSYKTDWMISLYSLVFIVLLAFYCLNHLPILDFRPYHIGANIPEGMEIPEGAKQSVYNTRFVMEKDGVQKEFNLENYPDSTWTFVEAKSILIEQGYEPPIHDFSLISVETGDDLTDDILASEGYTFLLVAYRLDLADDSYIDLINQVYDYSIENGYAFYAVTSSLDSDIEIWRDRTGAEYQFLVADDIMLKTVVRSNPGLLLLKKGTILNKWADEDIPDEYELVDRLENASLGKIRSVNNWWTCGICALVLLIPLMLMILQDVMFKNKINNYQPNIDKNEKENCSR